ncbi:hypothetical protein NDU88_009049 [Pleurodeles waltl]|uniref:Uncharacterized protein n=1 Tax=Pleurodeles waltl TaxID=8319 RepID=A0AAV7RXY5_PLEWA|nr:hypothetical protein NDU88_009049 [Pleurodeles waltl]
MIINLRRSKADQEGKRKYSSLDCLEEGTLCSVCRTKDYIAEEAHKSLPLFRHKDGSCLSLFRFIAVLMMASAKAGLRPGRLRTHLFHTGEATTVAVSGLSEECIKRDRQLGVRCFQRLHPAHGPKVMFLPQQASLAMGAEMESRPLVYYTSTTVGDGAEELQRTVVAEQIGDMVWTAKREMGPGTPRPTECRAAGGEIRHRGDTVRGK